MDESERLRNLDKIASKRLMKRDSERMTRLGDIVKQLMEEQISPQQLRFGSIAEFWGRLLPAELRRHCKIADISGGQLKVLVDLPSYMYELQLCSSELLKELQRQCPRAKIEKIKFVVG